MKHLIRFLATVTLALLLTTGVANAQSHEQLLIEAEDLGVKVRVVCPGAVETAVFDTAAYVGVRREAVTVELVLRQA